MALAGLRCLLNDLWSMFLWILVQSSFVISLGYQQSRNNRTMDNPVETPSEVPQTNYAVMSSADENSTKMSKRQQKRLAKREKWLREKPVRRAKEKEKRRLKIEEAKRKGKDLGPSRKMLKSLKMADSSCKLKIAFDLSLDKLMTEGELSKTLKQLHRCYSINRRASAPMQLYITGISSDTKQKLSKFSGFLNWDVHFKDEPYSEVFEKDNVVYLTSDSSNVLHNLDQDTAYIIGALVDHNRLKGICYERATEAGVKHARLPLDLYLEMKSRSVLTIDQVFLIFLRMTEGKSWEDTFLDVLPKRKGAVPKHFSKHESQSFENDDDTAELFSKQESQSFDEDSDSELNSKCDNAIAGNSVFKETNSSK